MFDHLLTGEDLDRVAVALDVVTTNASQELAHDVAVLRAPLEGEKDRSVQEVIELSSIN